MNPHLDIEVRIGVNPELAAIPGSRLFSPLYQGGGFTEKKYIFAQITAIAFSYIRTEFGASRSMRVGVRFDKQ